MPCNKGRYTICTARPIWLLTEKRITKKAYLHTYLPYNIKQDNQKGPCISVTTKRIITKKAHLSPLQHREELPRRPIYCPYNREKNYQEGPSTYLPYNIEKNNQEGPSIALTTERITRRPIYFPYNKCTLSSVIFNPTNVNIEQDNQKEPSISLTTQRRITEKVHLSPLQKRKELPRRPIYLPYSLEKNYPEGPYISLTTERRITQKAHLFPLQHREELPRRPIYLPYKKERKYQKGPSISLTK
jgi:hypothetical protein